MTWFTGVYPSEHRMTNKFAVYTPAEQKRGRTSRNCRPNLVTLADVCGGTGTRPAGSPATPASAAGSGTSRGSTSTSTSRTRFGGFDRSIPKALEWLRANRDRKFFLFLHGYDVHGQHVPAGGLDYRFVDTDYDRRYSGSEQEQEVLREEGLDRGQADPARRRRAVLAGGVRREDPAGRRAVPASSWPSSTSSG